MYLNINETFNKLQAELLKISDKHGSQITLSKRESKQRCKPWISKSILYSIKIKTRLYKKFINTKSKFWYSSRYMDYRDNDKETNKQK